jgi:MFS family permease
MMVYALLETMIIPTFPLMQADLHATPASIAWVFTGYLLSGAVTLPLVTRLADVRDKRVLLLAVIATVCLGMGVAGTATSVVQLAIGQTLQGVGISIVPLMVAITRVTATDERTVKRATALTIGVGFVANTVGNVVVGPITAVVHYRWLYLATLIVLTIILAAAFVIVPRMPAPGSGTVDWAGLILLTGGLGILLLGITMAPQWGWVSPRFMAFIVISVVLLLAFVVVERRVLIPLIDLRMGGWVIIVLCAISVAVGYVWISYQVTIPLITQGSVTTGYGLGGTAALTGLIILPMAIAGALVTPIVRPLRDRIGPRSLMVVAGGLIAASVVVQMTGGNVVTLAVASTLLGAGIGLNLTEALNVVVDTMPVDRVASACGLIYLLRNVGGTLGAQVGGSVLASSLLPDRSAPGWPGFMIVFGIALGIGVVGAAAAVALPARAGRSDHPALLTELGVESDIPPPGAR